MANYPTFVVGDRVKDRYEDWIGTITGLTVWADGFDPNECAYEITWDLPRWKSDVMIESTCSHFFLVHLEHEE